MKKFIILIALLFGVFLAMGGYRLVVSEVARLTSDFEVLKADNRILYEKGAEPLADAAAGYLSQAMAIVEARQYGSFEAPVKVYVFASAKSFSRFAGVPEVVIGAGLQNEVYLSGKLLAEPDKLPGILTHELSHVQLAQTLGTIRFNRTLPRWFREGLAIYVANGGGATNATEAETINSFLAGKHFIPQTEGGLFNTRLAATADLHPKIFYRQSGMFVRFLAESQPDRFAAMLKNLQKGKPFAAQFAEAFGKSADEVLKSFIATLRKA